MKQEDNPDKLNHLLSRKIRDNLHTRCGVGKTDTLVLGVSGGPDSTAMLYLLSTILDPSQLHAVYVDHQLRPDETQAEIDLLRNHCSSLNISLTVYTVNVPAAVQSSGDSVEDTARKLRYRRFEQKLHEIAGNWICVAHNADDQIEEFFVRLIRGTGTTGLSGMQDVSNHIIRPLLTLHKKELEDFLSRYQIPFSHDSSNDDQRYLRNRVRHSLLPFLQQNFHQSIGRNILRTSSILQDEDAFLDTQADTVLKTLFHENNHDLTIDCSLLSRQHIALQRRIIEKLLWKQGIRPSYTTINTLCDLAASGSRGKEIHLPGGLRVLRQADNLNLFFPNGRYNHRKNVAAPFVFSLLINATGIFQVEELRHQLTITIESALPSDTNGCLVLNNDRITFPLILRSIEAGEAFQPLGMGGNKKINRFLSDRKIEKHERRNYPLLLSRDKILCIVGLQIDENCRYDEQTGSFLVIRWEKY